MKYSAAVAILALSGANALSVSRGDLRSLGSKSITTSGSRHVGASMKMEGTFFGSLFLPQRTSNSVFFIAFFFKIQMFAHYFLPLSLN
jgi:hypothetical protein